MYTYIGRCEDGCCEARKSLPTCLTRAEAPPPLTFPCGPSPSRPPPRPSPQVKILQGGMQWKQGVVICIIS